MNPDSYDAMLATVQAFVQRESKMIDGRIRVSRFRE